MGEFEALLNNKQAALKYFRKSLQPTTLKSEQVFMSKKLRDLKNADEIHCS
jgi:hypothetical protein